MARSKGEGVGVRLAWMQLSAVRLARLVLGAAIVMGSALHALAQQPQSWTDSITSPFKQGFDKLGRTMNPKPSGPKLEADDDAISLKTEAKPGPDLHVALARLAEQAGKSAEADQNYQSALRLNPDHLPALLGHARLKDQLGKSSEALQLYQRAAKSHPQEAAVYNHLALCHARQENLDEAVASMNRAVQLEPKNPLYRNNMATLLVDQGRFSEALSQLRHVHKDAAAYYNMGYLLNKKGQSQIAMRYFATALKIDPSMDSARRWVEYLQRPTAQRLPPTRRIASNAPSLPGISYDDGPAAPTAPLPPPATNTALRPLPRVN